MDSAVPAGPSKGGNFRPGGRLLISTHPQSMLPLAARASRLLPYQQFRKFEVTSERVQRWVLVLCTGRTVRQRGPFSGAEILLGLGRRTVARCFERGRSGYTDEVARSRVTQLVSAGQGRKRLTQRMRNSSAPLRGECVPRRR